MPHKLDLVYVHFAKAGGTSISRILAGRYGDRVYWDTDHDPCNPAHNAHDPPCLPESIEAVQGHIRGDRYHAYSPRVLFTFLREPVDKMISQYFSWKALPPSDNPDHLAFLRDQPSIIEQARKDAGIAFPAYFGGMDMRDFDFIGFYDRREQDLQELSRIVGFPMPSHIRLNVTPDSEERRRIMSNSNLLAELRHILREDIEFYESVRALRFGAAA